MQWRPAHTNRILAGLAVAAAVMAATGVRAQTAHQADADRVEVLNADRWEFDQAVAPGAQRLIGNVRFKQGTAFMACDSAYLYEDDRVKAFGKVALTQGDTLRMTGQELVYDGRARTARMQGNVHLSDPGMELTTDALLYDIKARQVNYSQGARMVSKKDGTTLTSRKGTYHSGSRQFSFTDSVRLSHPERTIVSDTLLYRTGDGMVEFFGPTWIYQDGTDMYCERGRYNTRTGQGTFTRNGLITSGSQRLTGDSLLYDRDTGMGRAWGRVTVTDTAENMVVRGGQGTHEQSSGTSVVTGRAELVMIMGEDSLFLHGDTLFAFTDSLGRRNVFARRNVRFHKSDLQGVCDTMSYAQADSLITLLGQPFLWSKDDQISGDTIRIRMRDGHAETLHVDGHAFMASQVDSLHFNQVTGLTMTGRFVDDELRRLVAEGNSRTIYFAKETKDSVEQVTGMNRADCSIIVVALDSGQVGSVSFLTQPTATLFPLDQVPEGEMHLEGFRWNAAARPRDREDIFRVVEPAEE